MLADGTMTSKRSSHVYSDERRHHEESQSNTAAAYQTRQSSRSSSREDMMGATLEMDKIYESRLATADSSATSQYSSSSSTGSLANTDAVGTDVFPTVSSAMDLPGGRADPHLAKTGGHPANFGVVFPGLYRSSYPKPEDYDFLCGLNLSTIITLVQKDETDHHFDTFVSNNSIRHVCFNMKGTKKESIPHSTMRAILELTLDARNYPLLIHCNQGKHRTGCVVAAMRKLSGWSVDTTLNEYKKYAEPKVRECDVEYISALQSSSLHITDSERNISAEVSSIILRAPTIQSRTFWRLATFTLLALGLWWTSGSQMRRLPRELS